MNLLVIPGDESDKELSHSNNPRRAGFHSAKKAPEM
jgi:hypothetical protein